MAKFLAINCQATISQSLRDRAPSSRIRSNSNWMQECYLQSRIMRFAGFFLCDDRKFVRRSKILAFVPCSASGRT